MCHMAQCHVTCHMAHVTCHMSRDAQLHLTLAPMLRAHAPEHVAAFIFDNHNLQHQHVNHSTHPPPTHPHPLPTPLLTVLPMPSHMRWNADAPPAPSCDRRNSREGSVLCSVCRGSSGRANRNSSLPKGLLSTPLAQALLLAAGLVPLLMHADRGHNMKKQRQTKSHSANGLPFASSLRSFPLL